jgi:hypothetical protein
MSTLIDALRRKFNTPKDALRALGLDAALIEEKEKVVMAKMTPMALLGAGALDNYLRPRLAQDEQVKVLPFFHGVTSKNFAAKIPGIASGIKVATKGKLAEDADVEDISAVLEAVAELKPEIAQTMEASEADGELDDATEPMPEEDDEPPEMMAKVREFLKGCLKPEDLAKFDEMVGAAPEDVKEPEEVVEDDALTPEEKEKKMPVTKAAMDAAIAAAVSSTTARQVAIRDAEKAIRPYVGELTVACDSADAVYRTALEMLNVPKVKDIHPSAYPTILGMQKKRGVNTPAPRIAADTAGKSLTDFIPGISSIQRM